MKLKTFFFCSFFTIMCLLRSTTLVRAEITLAESGKSTVTIVLPANAPTSVQDAAAELQRDIELATGAKLLIQQDSAHSSGAVISLGATQQAQAAGLSSEKMADESFRIVTKNGDLFILGPDTPNGGWTAKNGTSTGTANGVYTFLEDYLNVRWLMPGDIGRDVPRKSTFAVGKIDRSFTPKFSWRRVTHLWDYANAPQYRSIRAWGDHMRLGGAVQLDYGHNWWRTVNNGKSGAGVNTPEVKALYAAHPEWFAMNAAGKRPYPNSQYAKFETTNPDLVRWFAEKAIAALKASDRPRTYSLSPSDGGGRWSKSPESMALYDPSPSKLFDSETNSDDPGTSSLVLKWYHDVAQIVAKEYPQGRLAGYIYSSYVYPPTKVAMKLPDNFTPVICGIGTYGYGLYRPDNQQRWKTVMDSWAKVAPKDWYYYDLPNQMLRQLRSEIGETSFPGSTGIITPAAPDILNTIFPQLLKSRIKGAYIYGVPSWSNAALGNYLLAKMEWDPTQNAETLQKEWLARAYGDKAGVVMEGFYEQLNGRFRAYWQQVPNGQIGSALTLDMLKNIYAAHYPDMEKVLLQAKAQPMTELQKQRFQLLEDNLIVLQWRLRNAGFLPENFASPLQRDDAQINALLTKDNNSFPNFPGATTSTVGGWIKPKPFSWKVQFAENPAPSASVKSTFRVLEDNQFLIYAHQNGVIRITPQLVTQGAYFPSYEIKNAKGETLISGILHTKDSIVWSAKKDDFFVLTIPNRKPVNYQLHVENAAIATADYQNDTLILAGKPAAAYIYAPPRDTPIGIMEEEGSVMIRKPFSGAAAVSYYSNSKDYTDVKVLKSLDEGWRFAPDPENDGLQRGVIDADFDDSDWATVNALNWWQYQGFPDYNGAAWYRIKFNLDELPDQSRAPRLYFGAVDGEAEIYLNGKKVRERKLGPAPDFKGWDSRFSTYVRSQIKTGENTLVVKVTNKPMGSAGITGGVSLLSLGRVEK